MPAKVYEGSIVRDSEGDEFEVLQLKEDEGTILVSPVDAEPDKQTGVLPGFWGHIEDFEMEVLRGGSGHGIYPTFVEINGFMRVGSIGG